MNHKYLFYILLSAFMPIYAAQKTPKITVIIVIDQFNASYYNKLMPYLHGGLKFLYQNGVYYSNAYYTHSLPSTAAGHTVLSTGTIGNYHGVINNKWYENNKVINFDDDSAENAAVFAPDGFYDFGKSAHHMMVDNLSDQAIMHSYSHANNKVWSLSLKSRAAIAMAGRLGKAIWFDTFSGNYTSSKAYFNELPVWVKQFNKEQKVHDIKEFCWHSFYPENDKAYKFANITNYNYSSSKTLIGRMLEIKPQTYEKDEGSYERFNKTPRANKILVELAKRCIDVNFENNKSEKLILWLSLSGLDKVGHRYGPFSKEAIDMLYHMDDDIQKLIDHIYKKVNPEEALFVLTGDHGGHPIVDILKDDGFNLARRLDPIKIKKEINEFVLKKYGFEDIIQHFKEPQYYFNKETINKLLPETKEKIIKDIKRIILSNPGIRNVWTFDELAKAKFSSYDLDVKLQRQLYKGRSGDIIFTVEPYVNIDKYSKGTGHLTPYNYDTHVPLIIYQNQRFNNKTIAKNVEMPQLAPTLAQILGIPRPSACNRNVLPELEY